MYRLAAHIPLVGSARPAVRVTSRLALVLAAAAAGLASVSLMEPVLLRAYYFPGLAAVTLCALLAGGRYALLTDVTFAAGFAWFFLEPRGVTRCSSGPIASGRTFSAHWPTTSARP